MIARDQTSTIRESLLKHLTTIQWLRVVVDMYGEKSNDIFFPGSIHKKIMDAEPEIVVIDNCGWVYGVSVELIQRGEDYETEKEAIDG